MSGPSQLSHAFEQGVDARAAGQSVADNPYSPDSPEGREWAAGHQATLDLDEEDDPASNRLRKEDELPDPASPGSRVPGITDI